ncbi:MAG TPA: hypothetical protein VF316_01360 [Polyangiaceae bacterium]
MSTVSLRTTLVLASASSLFVLSNACSSDDAPATTPSGTEAGLDGLDAGLDVAKEAAKVLADGLIDPIPYLSRADSPFNGVSFPSYFHLEDWEDGLVNTPGVTPSSTDTGATYGTLVDSVDGDDGVVDGKCSKDGGLCNSGFSNSAFSFTFDATVLGALPTHVGIAWTDGNADCDATFEAFDANDVSLGKRTAVKVGDSSNSGTVAEDRFFGIVSSAGIKKIVVSNSAGGVEVDHLQYGR